MSNEIRISHFFKELDYLSNKYNLHICAYDYPYIEDNETGEIICSEFRYENYEIGLGKIKHKGFYVYNM